MLVAASVSEWSLVHSLTLAATRSKPKQASRYRTHGNENKNDILPAALPTDAILRSLRRKMIFPLFQPAMEFILAPFITLLIAPLHGVSAAPTPRPNVLFNWPQTAGPNGNWTVTTKQSVPLKWSVEKNENIRWRVTLPEVGQSGIAVSEDRLFLTTLEPLAADAPKKTGSDIVLHFFNAATGAPIWQREGTHLHRSHAMRLAVL